MPWLVDSTYALAAVIITNIWIGIPFSMAVFHSGLQSLPKELLEAAELDGAGPVQRFFRVILPLLKPLTTIVFILSVTYTVKVFDLIFVLTGGGPADATQTLAIYSYKLSFRADGFRARGRRRQRADHHLALLRLLLHPLLQAEPDGGGDLMRRRDRRGRDWLKIVVRLADRRVPALSALLDDQCLAAAARGAARPSRHPGIRIPLILDSYRSVLA